MHRHFSFSNDFKIKKYKNLWFYRHSQLKFSIDINTSFNLYHKLKLNLYEKDTILI
jgi:hypothetical protein